MNLVITTVGTSLFENFIKEKSGYGDMIGKLNNIRHDRWNVYEDRVNRIRNYVQDWLKTKKDIEMASAEIKSLNQLFKTELNKNEWEVHLIATDTVLSRLAAEIIRDTLADKYRVHFEADGIPSDVIPGLQIFDRKEFEKEGLVNLLNRLENLTNSFYRKTVLNITGGYKALIPFLTIIAQIKNIPLFYIFEDTEELIKIPQVPITINWGMFEKYGDVLKDLQNGIMDFESYKREKQIHSDFSACIWEEEGMAELNAIGHLFYNIYQQFLMVYVLQNGPFSTQEAFKHQNELNSAIQDLVYRLNGFINSNRLQSLSQKDVYNELKKKGGEYLAHAHRSNLNVFIYKHPANRPEIRLLYDFKFENGSIKQIRIYDFRVGSKKENYLKEFFQFYENVGEGQFIPYLQVKGREHLYV